MATRGINKVILVGNLGNQSEHRVMTSGGGVTNISIATSESWKDKNTGQMRSSPSGTVWFFSIAWQRFLQSTCARALRCMSRVHCEHVSGRTNPVKIVIRLKSLQMRCRCWIAVTRVRTVAVTHHRPRPCHRRHLLTTTQRLHRRLSLLTSQRMTSRFNYCPLGVSP